MTKKTNRIHPYHFDKMNEKIKEEFYEEWHKSGGDRGPMEAIEEMLFSPAGIFPHMSEEEKRKIFLSVAVRRLSRAIYDAGSKRYFLELYEELENRGLLKTSGSPDNKFSLNEIYRVFDESGNLLSALPIEEIIEKLENTDKETL